MPAWLLLVAVGIVLVCAGYYLTMPPPVKNTLIFVGIVCLIFGALMFAVAILAMMGAHLPG